jgi:hypothetical protein
VKKRKESVDNTTDRVYTVNMIKTKESVMKGSEKQIEWAEDIKAQFQEGLYRYQGDMCDTVKKWHENADRFLESLTDEAHVWIELRTDLNNPYIIADIKEEADVWGYWETEDPRLYNRISILRRK